MANLVQYRSLASASEAIQQLRSVAVQVVAVVQLFRSKELFFTKKQPAHMMSVHRETDKQTLTMKKFNRQQQTSKIDCVANTSFPTAGREMTEDDAKDGDANVEQGKRQKEWLSNQTKQEGREKQARRPAGRECGGRVGKCKNSVIFVLIQRGSRHIERGGATAMNVSAGSLGVSTFR